MIDLKKSKYFMEVTLIHSMEKVKLFIREDMRLSYGK
jgi:hypothetical protein